MSYIPQNLYIIKTDENKCLTCHIQDKYASKFLDNIFPLLKDDDVHEIYAHHIGSHMYVHIEEPNKLKQQIQTIRRSAQIWVHFHQKEWNKHCKLYIKPITFKEKINTEKELRQAVLDLINLLIFLTDWDIGTNTHELMFPYSIEKLQSNLLNI